MVFQVRHLVASAEEDMVLGQMVRTGLLEDLPARRVHTDLPAA